MIRSDLIDPTHLDPNDIADDVTRHSRPLRLLVVPRVRRDSVVLSRNLLAWNSQCDDRIDDGTLALRIVSCGGVCR